MDTDTHRLPHQNAAAVEHTLSHLHKICPTEREKVGRKGERGAATKKEGKKAQKHYVCSQQTVKLILFL